MKKILKPLFCAAALVSLAGCNKFDEANATPETSNGSLIKVYANVAENDGTRANIHVGESAFTAEWEAGDALGILPVKTGGTAPATAAKFDYNTTSAAFEGSLNDFAAGGGNYYAFFPHAQVSGTTAKLPFGNLRTQAGNDFNSAGQIRALYEFDGTHTFAFTMTDAKGVSSEAVLTLVVDKSSGQTGPRITWRGYDIDQQYEVQKDMVIDIDIEADKGIKSFFVTIDSETLRPLLPVINLPEKFDICDIPDELVEVLHGEFGFPINEQVKNRTSVTFSITKFVEILLEIPGEHNFVLDVTDNDNVLTHKTVKLIVH